VQPLRSGLIGGRENDATGVDDMRGMIAGLIFLRNGRASARRD